MSKTLLRHTLIKKIFLTFLLTPYLYTFSLFENPSFIIFSAETEYISTRSWYRNINFLRDRMPGYHVLNIQCAYKTKKQFLNVVTRWPGSTHDAHIWNNSNLPHAFESGQIHNDWLLGDSAYGLKPWLLTPVWSTSTAKERKYNTAHKFTRSVIERTYGIWKMRFRCLYRGLTLCPRSEMWMSC